jgi:aldose 1-epimerase
VRLTDAAHDVEVLIVPCLGNRATQMKVRGRNILYHPRDESSGGIPFLAPWADLLDEQAFWANGKRYAFNRNLANIQGGLPLHGLLTASPLWQVIEVAADGWSAYVSSRLQFWKYPDLMAQWPFAHEYVITYRLADGVLEVRTTITNLSADVMPVAIGFHPYLQIPDTPRDDWVAHLPARKRVIALGDHLKTGHT